MTPPPLSLESATSPVSSNNAIRMDPTFSDVLLLVGTSKIPIFAHAAILSQNCKYYAKGVEIDAKRSKSLRAVLSHPDVEIETLHTILEFIYTGTAKVALFADQRLLPSVKSRCLDHFAANILTAKNAFEFYTLCDTLGQQDFKDSALLKAASNVLAAVDATCCGMHGEQLEPLIRFKRLGSADKWRLLISWAKAQQACEDLSIEAGITTDFDAVKKRDDIAGFCSFTPTQVRLLFRASEHEFSEDAFHQVCDGKRNILTVIKTAHGRVVGGFAGSAWNSSGERIAVDELCLRGLKRWRLYPTARDAKSL
ncbi:hypothetical protein HDU98_007884 [Podochytrium sp. JEL0797]|nr:hypothetical protein HDU98_007884 [Podochytrium sp. JEL0797]